MLNNINVVLAGDQNYAEIMGVTILSILDNLKEGINARFFLFTDGFTEKHIKELNKIKNLYSCEINNISVEKYSQIFDFVNQENFKNKHISKSCLYRLLMFKYLPDNIEECFYIDSDIVANGDISDIHLPDNKIFAAVPEGFAMQHREKILSHWYKIPEFSNFVKNPFKYTHFGAGFYLANLKKSKELNVFEQMIELLKKYPAMPYADQDILNAIFGQKYQEFMHYLPPQYNVFADMDYSINYDKIPFSNEYFQYACKHPIIIHYAGADKPWINDCCNRFFDDWWKYYKKTPWKISYLKRYTKIIIKKRIMHFVQEIFSIKNDYNHKVISILGIKIKYKINKYRPLIINENTSIYVVSPKNICTGGPEALQTLTYELRKKGLHAYIFFVGDGDDKNPVPEPYKKYDNPWVLNIDDNKENILIIPETIGEMIGQYKNSQKMFWWLSVDNYLIFSDSDKRKQIDFKDKSILHLVQSKYAFEFLNKKHVKNIKYLSDYLNETYTHNLDYNIDKKENIVLYNPKKGYHYVQKIIEKAPDITFIPIENMLPEQIRELYKRSKIYIDFGTHPGKDRIPREAAMFGNIIFTNKEGSAFYQEDVSIPESYKFCNVDDSIERIIEKIKYCFLNYKDCIKDFSNYRESISNEKQTFLKEIEEIFK